MDTLKLIQAFEGLRLSSYDDGTGTWTIGYGHTLGVKPGQKITKEQADQFLEEDMIKATEAISKIVKVSLTSDQLSALISFTFNLGINALTKSTLLKKLNAGDYAGASAEFPKWINAGGKPLEGLKRRRAAERALFDTVVPKKEINIEDLWVEAHSVSTKENESMFGGFFKNVFAKRAKAWAAAVVSAAMLAAFQYLDSVGVKLDAVTQAGVTAAVVGVVTHQIDNVV